MFTAVDDRHHRAARFDLLPFVVAILGDESVPRKGHYLPVGDPSALTHEAITAIENICRQAVPAFLCRMGWAEVDYVSTGEQRRRGRIWETMHDAPALSYSDASIDTLLTVYNMTRAPTRDQSKEMEPPAARPPDCTGGGAIGDQLVHHIVLRRFADMVPEFTGRQAFFFGNNPLNVLSRFDRFESLFNLDMLLAGSLARWFPWLAHEWVGGWLRLESNRWGGDGTTFRSFNDRQHRHFTSWIDSAIAIDRPDLLSPLINYYARTTRAADGWGEAFTGLTHNMARGERQALAESRIESLAPALRLGELYNQTRGVHPVDREPPQQLFMEAYTAYSFGGVVETIERHRGELLPSIG